jgi:adenosylmethionine-8-amino-7-oxononanoate aminotransferase
LEVGEHVHEVAVSVLGTRVGGEVGVDLAIGSAFGGHPVAAAVAMRNLDIMQNEKINEALI